MICISGVPGSGKTFLSGKLSEMGFHVEDLNKLALENGCMEGDVVDVDRLSGVISAMHPDIVEAHYSHLLPCTAAIITGASFDVLQQRLLERGYPDSKIEENLEAAMSNTIFYEALDRLPLTRIMRVDTTNDIDEEKLNTISLFIKKYTL
ncbi:MAG: AAA family ATPase [Thermoplasmataceae archaeon]